jgi:hypothetical protein
MPTEKNAVLRHYLYTPTGKILSKIMVYCNWFGIIAFFAFSLMELLNAEGR